MLTTPNLLVNYSLLTTTLLYFSSLNLILRTSKDIRPEALWPVKGIASGWTHTCLIPEAHVLYVKLFPKVTSQILEVSKPTSLGIH